MAIVIRRHAASCAVAIRSTASFIALPTGLLQELAPRTCGLLYGGCRCSAPAFSLLFPAMAAAGGQQCGGAEDDRSVPCGGGMVDCTLSLGTPSTRRADQACGGHGHGHGHAAPAPVELLAWDVPSARPAAGGKQDSGARAGAASCKEVDAAGCLPAARRCANCDATSTPLWRNGPRGPKSLCNACGIRYKKEERRAAAAVSPAPLDSVSGYAACCYARQQAKSASFAMFGDVIDAADDGSSSYLSWRINMVPSSPAFAVRERPTLSFQYY